MVIILIRCPCSLLDFLVFPIELGFLAYFLAVFSSPTWIASTGAEVAYAIVIAILFADIQLIRNHSKSSYIAIPSLKSFITFAMCFTIMVIVFDSNDFHAFSFVRTIIFAFGLNIAARISRQSSMAKAFSILASSPCSTIRNTFWD